MVVQEEAAALQDNEILQDSTTAKEKTNKEKPGALATVKRTRPASQQKMKQLWEHAKTMHAEVAAANEMTIIAIKELTRAEEACEQAEMKVRTMQARVEDGKTHHSNAHGRITWTGSPESSESRWRTCRRKKRSTWNRWRNSLWKPSGSSRRSKPSDSWTRREIALWRTSERGATRGGVFSKNSGTKNYLIHATDPQAWGPGTHTVRTVERRTEFDYAEHNQLKPTWAQRRSGRGLHAAERLGEAQNPGRDNRTLQWEEIDKIPFTTHEGREERICCTKPKTKGTDGPQQRQWDMVLNAWSEQFVHTRSTGTLGDHPRKNAGPSLGTTLASPVRSDSRTLKETKQIQKFNGLTEDECETTDMMTKDDLGGLSREEDDINLILPEQSDVPKPPHVWTEIWQDAEPDGTNTEHGDRLPASRRRRPEKTYGKKRS